MELTEECSLADYANAEQERWMLTWGKSLPSHYDVETFEESLESACLRTM